MCENYEAGPRNFRKTPEATSDIGNLTTRPRRVIFGGKLSTAILWSSLVIISHSFDCFNQDKICRDRFSADFWR